MQLKRDRERKDHAFESDWINFNVVDCVILKNDFSFEFLFLYLTELVVYTR